ncbi:MAG: hypothetical protein JO159_12595 [Acidobacteria bacterium]|nr:hypothetical protein [Acidobacteriota bacterium]
MKLRGALCLEALLAAIFLLFHLAPVAAAQDDRDPPARAGRIDYVQGSVSFQPGGSGEWLNAVPNRPLTSGDNLWADRDSRAEVQIGSTSIRLGSETSVTFLDLDHINQLRLSMGTLFFRVRHLDQDDNIEIDTPNLAFTVYQPGEYRLDVNQNGDQTLAMVWRGEGEITGGGNSYRLSAGQQGTFSGVDQLRYDVGEIGPYDSFDRWCLSRDDREDHVRSARYVSPEITGYQDLDEYGRWHNAGDYGYVWTPAGVPYGWAPYRYGHWVYVAPWGWTWVEEEPWGFAPFHYGRWAFVDSAWCWVPGPMAVAPVYSPALVAFVGGGGFNMAIGVGGGVGWFPLAPGEVFVPWYRTSPRYVQNVNITNTRVNVVQVTNVYNNVTVNNVSNVTYVNQRVANSVTVVNRDTFVNARPVAANLVRVDARQVASAPVTHEVARNLQPAPQSIVGAAHRVAVAPPAQVMSRPVVATREPAPPVRPTANAGVRTVTPPPIRTVRAVPPSEAQPLPRGAHGAVPAAGTRPAEPLPGGARAGAPNNPPAPERGPVAPQPRIQENPAGTPGRGESVGGPPATGNNRPGREVPRPPSARPEPQPGAEQQRPSAPYSRPESPRTTPEQPVRPETRQPAVPQPGAEQQRPSAPYSRPETPRTMPEQPVRPESRPQPAAPPSRVEAPPRPDNRTEPAPRPEARPATPPQRGGMPEQPRGNAPYARPEAPRQEAPRPESPRPETRPAPPSDQRHPAPPQARMEAPARPAPHEGRSGGSTNGSSSSERNKDKEPARYR